MAVIPWQLTTSGPFVLVPARTFEIVAPDSGIVADVFVREGTRVLAGAPVVRIVDRALEREFLSAARAVDSLSAAVSRARALNQIAQAARLGTGALRRSRACGRAIALAALTLRAGSGVVRARGHSDPRDDVGSAARLESRSIVPGLRACVPDNRRTS